MLNFFESFQQYNVPESLQGEIFSADGAELELLKTFNKINIFVGPNNSGKSLILREMLKQENSCHYSPTNWEKILSICNHFWLTTENAVKQLFGNTDLVISNSASEALLNFHEFFVENTKLLTYSGNYKINQTIKYLSDFTKNMNSANPNVHLYKSVGGQPAVVLGDNERSGLFTVIKQITERTTETIEALKPFYFSNHSQSIFPKYYIPPVRTLRQFGATGELLKSTINDYGFKENINVINGQQFPRQILEWKNDDEDKRERAAAFENMLSVEFFESKPIKLAPRLNSNVLFIKIGSEKEKPVHSLGDGLQMLICLTHPFFFDYTGIVFIDEPELFIHPGLQKAFLKFLIENKHTNNFQVFLSTHSNHILDAINQSHLVSIFSVSKKQKSDDGKGAKSPDFIIENLANGHENLLNCLGISTTSVYLANCTIWVEGITDKIYLQKFISVYVNSLDQTSKYFHCKFYKEGVHYAFTLSGGDSIIHWDFSDESELSDHINHLVAKTFCSKALVIVDDDFQKNPERKNTLSAILGKRFIVHELPEIENYLSPEVISDTIMDYPSVKSKVENNSLPVIEQLDLETYKIGYVIDNIILKDFKGQKVFSKDIMGNTGLKSGEKVEFCKKALNHITISNISPRAIELVEKILDFVISRNTYTV